MSFKAEFGTAVGTVACAFCIGYVMQSGEVADLRYGSGTYVTASVTSSALVSGPTFKVRDMAFVQNASLVDVEKIELASADLSEAQSDILSGLNADGQAIEELAYEAACDLTARAEHAEGSNILLTVEAPCFGDELVTVSHAQSDLSTKLSPNGLLQVTLPATDDAGTIKVSFSNGERITALIRM